MATRQEIGAFIRERRKQVGLSQTELARRAGITQSTVSYLESGSKDLGASSFSRILAVLGMDPEPWVRPGPAAGSRGPAGRTVAREAADSALPLLGRVAAGESFPLAHQVLAHHAVGEDLFRPDRFLVRAESSLPAAGILAGDIVVLQHVLQKSPVAGDTVAAVPAAGGAPRLFSFGEEELCDGEGRSRSFSEWRLLGTVKGVLRLEQPQLPPDGWEQLRRRAMRAGVTSERLEHLLLALTGAESSA